MLKKLFKNKAFLITAAVILGCAIIAYPIYMGARALVKTVMGSDNCVISEDYDSIVLLGERYVPLDCGDLTYDIGRCLVEEASVEGAGFFSKLLFGDSIYTVEGSRHHELIYLQTDYDPVPSRIYCLAEKEEYYKELIASFEGNELYFEIIDSNGSYIDRAVPASLIELFTDAKLEKTDADIYAYDDGSGDCLSVKAYDENGIFYTYICHVMRIKGTYYCCYGDNYIIPDEYYASLDKFFSYLNN